jgi:hypothetical protein
MAITELSLPVDIPWKRMGVSVDMIDTKPGALEFPDKWRSSIAIFYHEPTDTLPEYCNRKITYLKVACTITNYQFGENYGDSGPGEDEGDVTVLKQLRDQFADFYGWDTFHGNVTRSFPCYGALLQIAVYPDPAEKIAPEDYPYISAFQPRKREMYEAVTESGEVASQSANKLNVLKGTTGTSTNESYDLDLGGGGWSASGIFGLGSASVQSGQGQHGTINRDQSQNQNVTTADASREKRESNAYSTNINQLYTLLQGYHLGTNRAMFLMEPRPHLQDAKFTFVRGLRRLEGIQEFFFILDRPKTTPGICVEAALETAHYFAFRDYEPRLISYPDLFTPEYLGKTAAALGIDVNDPRYQTFLDLTNTWNRFDPWPRFVAREYRDQRVSWDQVNAWVNSGQFSWVDFSNLVKVTELLPDVGLEDIALIFEEFESDSGPWAGEFFVTGRRLHCCVTPPAKEDDTADCEQSQVQNLSKYKEGASIVHESRYDGIPTVVSNSQTGAAALPLNYIVRNMNDTLASSLGSFERYPYGTVSFLQTELMLDQLAQLVRLLGKAGIHDRALTEVESLQEEIEKGLGRSSGVRTLLDLGRLSTAQVAKDLGIGRVDAKAARHRILLAALQALDPATLPAKINIENPILERQSAAMSAEQRLALERSGHPSVKKNPTPTKRKYWPFSSFISGGS